MPTCEGATSFWCKKLTLSNTLNHLDKMANIQYMKLVLLDILVFVNSVGKDGLIACARINI
jgi:hypothetical protein